MKTGQPTQTTTSAGVLRDRLGFPSLTGHRALAGALIVDSLGDGLFVPFAVVYFLRTTSLSLQAIGFGLSIAGFLAIPAVLAAGVLIDRFPPAAVVITGNLLSAIAFTGYLTVGRTWQLVAFALLAAIGSRFFWTANLALVGEAVDAAERSQWFAFQRMVRNAGFGLGGLLAAATLEAGTELGYRALAVGNAVSFTLAAVLVFRWFRRHRSARGDCPALRTDEAVATPAAHGRGDYRTALRDGLFLLLTGTNLLFVLCMNSLDVLLAVYLVRDLRQPVWLSGVLFSVNTVVVMLAQTVVSSAARRLRPARVLRSAAGIWAASFILLWGLDGVPRSAVIPGAFVAIGIFAAAEMIQGPALNDFVLAVAPESLRGRYLAVYQMSWAVGSAASPALFSSLLAIGPAWPWITLTACCGVCVLVLGRLGQGIEKVRSPSHDR